MNTIMTYIMIKANVSRSEGAIAYSNLCNRENILGFSSSVVSGILQQLCNCFKKIPGWIKILFLTIFLSGFFSGITSAQPGWIKIDDGLHYNEFTSPLKSDAGNSKIFVLRINPEFFDFFLFSASEHPEGQVLSVREWVEKYGLIAAINAGMFQKDLKSNVGYMKNFGHFNNPKIHKNYHSVFAFHPRKTELNSAGIFDIDVNNIKEIIEGYDTVIQNLRLIKRPGLNQWSRQEKRWSEAALGQDHDGNILFIFSESPYSMHDLVEILLKLPVKIACAQHLDGGSAAAFYMRYNKTEIFKAGRYKTNSLINSPEAGLLPVPNIIGIKKK